MFHRQLVMRGVGSPTPRSIQNIVPPSILDALNPSHCYRFVDSNEQFVSPPTTLSIKNNLLAVGNDSGDVVILNKNNLQEVTKFNAHNHAIFDLKWRPSQSNHVLTCDKSIILWDVERERVELANIPCAHFGSIKSLSFYDKNVFASGGRDGAIKLWDLRVSHVTKCGPEFMIEEPHFNTLPSVKSPRAYRASRLSSSSKQSPIANASKSSRNYLASNVVTCVNFNPTYNHHLYSSGISDNSIKIWDIRRCSRQFKCGNIVNPLKYHSIKSGKSLSSNGHGFTTFMFNTHPKYGNVLYASCTDSRVYAFLSDNVNPVQIFSGRYGNYFTK